MVKRKPHVLFICAANVFRSKLAEQAMRDSYRGRVIVRSAGILRPPAGAEQRTWRSLKHLKFCVLTESNLQPAYVAG